MADFQSNLMSKTDNLMGAKYYKSDPIAYKYIQQKMPVFASTPFDSPKLALFGAFDTIDTLIDEDHYMYDIGAGFGMNTGGSLMSSTGYSKDFGTFGMSEDIEGNHGYVHPVEEAGSCVDKFTAIFVVPVSKDFEQGSEDTLSITVSVQEPMEIDLENMDIDLEALTFKLTTNDLVAEGYKEFAQDQELAEFLGAKYLAGAAASVATLAAMTLF